jgi:hypothetical protein
VEACLSFDPDQRQTPAALAHALRLVLASLPETAGHEAALLSAVAAQQTTIEGLRGDITVIRQELGAVRQERDSAAQRFQREIAIIRQERDATASEVAALRQELAAVRTSAAAAADTASLRGDLSALMEELRRTRPAVTSPPVCFIPMGRVHVFPHADSDSATVAATEICPTSSIAIASTRAFGSIQSRCKDLTRCDG